MKKVIFRDGKNRDVFVVLDLNNFILPSKGQGIIWMSLFMFVDSVDHNYDTKEIIVFVTIQ